jgi:hypothetical protein
VEASKRDGDSPVATRRAGARAAAIATLAVGAIALAGGLALALSQASVRRTGTNDVTVSGIADTLRGGHRLCQGGELLPADTTTVELTATAGGSSRPALAVEALDASTHARVAAGIAARWRDESALVPLRPVPARDRPVRVCVRLCAPVVGAAAQLFGAPAERPDSATDDGEAVGGRIRLDYLRAGAQTWWSFAPTVAARIGRAHAWSGTSVALAAALLTLASIALAGWLLARPS